VDELDQQNTLCDRHVPKDRLVFVEEFLFEAPTIGFVVTAFFSEASPFVVHFPNDAGCFFGEGIDQMDVAA